MRRLFDLPWQASFIFATILMIGALAAAWQNKPLCIIEAGIFALTLIGIMVAIRVKTGTWW